MKIINNDWEFTSHWSEAFLQGGASEVIVRLPHTVKEVPLHERPGCVLPTDRQH